MYLIQGGVSSGFFCGVQGEGAEKAMDNYMAILDPDRIKIRGIIVEGSDGKLHTLGIEGAEMEITSIEEIDEDMPEKYKDCQIGTLTVDTNMDTND